MAPRYSQGTIQQRRQDRLGQLRSNYERNKEKWQAKYEANKEANREKAREHGQSDRAQALYRERRFNLSQEERGIILLRQGGGCAICGVMEEEGKRLHVDHDHKSGEVRGLLCGLCNRGIGSLRDDEDLVRKAARYLYLFNRKRKARKQAPTGVLEGEQPVVEER